MKRVIVVIFAIGFLFSCGNSLKERHLTVSGTGTQSYSPDMVSIKITHQAVNMDTKIALSTVSQSISQLLSLCKSLGISENDIVTSNVIIAKQYEYQNNSSYFVGYTVTQQTSIKIKDISKYGDFLVGISKITGLREFSDVEFSSSNMHELENSAMMKALDDANLKADNIAAQMKVKKGQVLQINTIQNNSNYPVNDKNAFFEIDEKSLMNSPEISTGFQFITVKVVVDFDIQ